MYTVSYTVVIYATFHEEMFKFIGLLDKQTNSYEQLQCTFFGHCRPDPKPIGLKLVDAKKAKTKRLKDGIFYLTPCNIYHKTTTDDCSYVTVKSIKITETFPIIIQFKYPNLEQVYLYIHNSLHDDKRP